jgi:hypothetical protein
VKRNDVLFFRHSGEGLSLRRIVVNWIPAFAGMTAGLLMLVACATNETQEGPNGGWPDWLQEKIKAQPVPVEKYTYKGAKYFLLDYKTICCDISSKLFDENGVLICHPSGGFTGGGDMNCPCFVNKFLSLRHCKN